MGDTSGNTINCISPQMPVHTAENLDFAAELRQIVGMWGEEIYSIFVNSPTQAFWSLSEIQEWVRDHAVTDIYGNLAGGTPQMFNSMSVGMCFHSINKNSIDALYARACQPKSHLIKARVLDQMTPEVDNWISTNCAGKTYTVMGLQCINTNTRENNYSFKEEADATLFRIRWTGHPEVALL
jgi:hypothetical protein